MAKYIDRDTLLAGLDDIWDCSDIVFPNGRDHICKVPEECKGCKWRDVLAAFKEMVKHAPAADVEPVVHEHWIDTGYCGPHHMIIVQCSACKKESEGSMDDMRCPNCGAKMDGEVTE